MNYEDIEDFTEDDKEELINFLVEALQVELDTLFIESLDNPCDTYNCNCGEGEACDSCEGKHTSTDQLDFNIL